MPFGVWLAVLAFALLTIAIALTFVHGLWLHALKHRQQRRKRPLSLKVDACERVGPDLLRLTLVHPRRYRLPAFCPGQHITLCAPETPSLQRRYSLAAWVKRPDRYELCIKREPQGRLSGWLHDAMTTGLILPVLRPEGHFIWQPQPMTRHVILIAGGVGITPLRAMLHHWQHLPITRRPRLTLYYAARTPCELVWHDELMVVSQSLSDFAYHPSLSRPEAGWTGLRGRLDAERISPHQDLLHTEFYLCASNSMMRALEEGLIARGVLAEHIHYEAFGIAAASGIPHQPLCWNGTSLTYQGEPTLLMALEAQGVHLRADCRAGECGQCAVRCTQGDVEWLLPKPARLPEGHILTCCTRPLSPVTLTETA